MIIYLYGLKLHKFTYVYNSKACIDRYPLFPFQTLFLLGQQVLKILKSLLDVTTTSDCIVATFVGRGNKTKAGWSSFPLLHQKLKGQQPLPAFNTTLYAKKKTIYIPLLSLSLQYTITSIYTKERKHHDLVPFTSRAMTTVHLNTYIPTYAVLC